MSLLPFPRIDTLRSRFRFDRWTDMLGEGAFATVFKAQRVREGDTVALKVVKKSRLDNDRALRDMIKEVEIGRKIQHPNCGRVLEVLQTDADVVMVLQMAPGVELFDAIRNAPRGRMSEDAAATIAWQLLAAMKYLHTHRIVHRDVKPENVMVGEHEGQTHHVTLIDFGLAKYIGAANTGRRPRLLARRQSQSGGAGATSGAAVSATLRQTAAGGAGRSCAGPGTMHPTFLPVAPAALGSSTHGLPPLPPSAGGLPAMRSSGSAGSLISPDAAAAASNGSHGYYPPTRSRQHGSGLLGSIIASGRSGGGGGPSPGGPATASPCSLSTTGCGASVAGLSMTGRMSASFGRVLSTNSIESLESTASHGSSPMLTTPCGTLKYNAPEAVRSMVLHGADPQSTTRADLGKRDVFALGVVCFVMLSGQLPFTAGSKAELLEQMSAGVAFDSSRWAAVSAAAKEFVGALLAADPEMRPTAAEACERFEWIRRGRTDVLENGAAVGREADVGGVAIRADEDAPVRKADGAGCGVIPPAKPQTAAELIEALLCGGAPSSSQAAAHPSTAAAVAAPPVAAGKVTPPGAQAGSGAGSRAESLSGTALGVDFIPPRSPGGCVTGKRNRAGGPEDDDAASTTTAGASRTRFGGGAPGTASTSASTPAMGPAEGAFLDCDLLGDIEKRTAATPVQPVATAVPGDISGGAASLPTAVHQSLSSENGPAPVPALLTTRPSPVDAYFGGSQPLAAAAASTSLQSRSTAAVPGTSADHLGQAVAVSELPAAESYNKATAGAASAASVAPDPGVALQQLSSSSSHADPHSDLAQQQQATVPARGAATSRTGGGYRHSTTQPSQLQAHPAEPLPRVHDGVSLCKASGDVEANGMIRGRNSVVSRRMSLGPVVTGPSGETRLNAIVVSGDEADDEDAPALDRRAIADAFDAIVAADSVRHGDE